MLENALLVYGPCKPTSEFRSVCAALATCVMRVKKLP